jgi:hypothetical protein
MSQFIVEYLLDLRLWLPSLAAATTLALYIQLRRKTNLEIEKLQMEVRRLREDRVLYKPGGKEIDELLEKIRPFSLPRARFTGGESPFEAFAPRLNDFILSHATTGGEAPDVESIARDWESVRKEAASRLGLDAAKKIDDLLRLGVRAKREKRGVYRVDLATYRRLNEQLAEALGDGPTERVISLLRDGADPDGQPGADEPPVILAAHSGKADLVEALLDAGADPARRGGQRRTPLIIAARQGHLEVVRSLLRHDRAFVDDQDQAGLTALMHAVKGAHQDVVEALLEAGADATLEDENGQTALARAIKGKHTQIEALLRGAGATG